MRPRWLLILSRVIVVVFGLLVLLWIGAAWYIHSHKKQLLNQITEALSNEVNGSVSIREMRPVLWKSFPYISIGLTDISLRDSLWQQHHRSLIEARALYVRVNPFSLIQKKINIRKLTLSEGYFHLFTDSSGYSNKYLLQGKKEQKKKNGVDISFRKVALEDFTLILRDYIKQKDFRVHFKELDGTIEEKNKIWNADLQLWAEIQSFTFNTDKGSFLKDAVLKSRLKAQFDPTAKTLTVDNQPIKINGSPIHLSASFDFGNTPPPFTVKIHSRKTHFQTAATWLSPSIYSKLDSIFFEHPMDLRADIRGHMKFRDTPTVYITWQTSKNELQTPFADFTECSFEGYFLNELIPGKGHSDSNTVIVIRNASAKWGNIPFYSDSVRLENLTYPLLQFAFHSAFPLRQLNDVPVTLPFLFEDGQADVRVHYRGGVNTDDTLHPHVDGHIRVDNAAFTYLPRRLTFKGAHAELLLQEDNLLFKNISFKTRSSNVAMNGDAAHFFRFYFADPGKVTINWQTNSEVIDLSDFITLLTKRQQLEPNKKSGTSNRNRGAAKIINQLDKVLDASNIVLDVQLKKVRYHNFVATNIRAKTALSQSDIQLSGIHLQHAGGTISASGHINQAATNNPFNVSADVNNVDIDKLFYAFDNFGLNILRDTNIKGQFSAKARLRGQITDNGTLLPYSTNGFVNFSLKNGALINFDPLIKVSKFAFKKRNLSHVVFKDIQNRLDIEGDKVVIHPMTIASSALYIDIKGLYGFKAGTDIAIAIPLRNPAKDGFDVREDVIPKSERKRKGVTLNLRAKDDGKGNVKLTWDPQKKGAAAVDSLLGIHNHGDE